MIKNCFYILFLAATLISCKQSETDKQGKTDNDLKVKSESDTKEKTNLLGKEVSVYTTAENTVFR